MNDQISGQTDVTGATLQGHQDAPPLDPGMVCMSVVEDGPRIAFAAYNEDLNCIIVEYAVVDGYETQDIVERVLSVIRPTLILISNKIVANDNLLELLTTPPIQLAQGTKNAKDPLDTNEAAHGLSPQSIDDSGLAQPSPTRRRSIPYRMMKTASFDIRNSKTIITQKLRVRSLMRQLYKDLGRGVAGQQANRHFPLTVDQPQNRSFGVSAYHALASIIDFDSNVQVQALGSLLSFLHTTVFRLEQGGFITVNDLVPAKASLYMTISPTTLSTLHIFNTEHHPLAAAKGASNSKEGFSLFSLLDRTKSRTGRQRLRDWMLKPLLDVDAIRLRQDGVELFMQEDLQVAVGSILNLLGKVGAVDKILVRIQKCCAKPNDFLVLTRSLAAGIAICGNLQQDILWNLQRISVGHTTDDETAPCINEPPSIEEARVETAVLRYLNFVASILRNCHIDIIHEIHERITSIVDEELTSECQSVVIRVGFHERLDIYKRQYDGLDEIMKDVATALGDQYPLLRDVLKVMFMPQVGFLVALPPSPQWMENGALPDDFEYVFSESLSYFKSAEMRQLDQNIGDLDAFIKDAETLIVAELEDEILDHESELRETFIALAELDCILSFAGAAADLDFVRPRVVSASEQCVEISRGRHPLQEIVLDTAFVPNDTTMNTTSRVTVITGPNFSGKSCFARQVGVLVYMAHIGCFLPCDEARISLTDQIFTQFSSTETCAVPQSSFQLDLSRMGAILRRASQHSLVLIDEFGKGTSPASGISLLTAALQKLVSNRSKVICTTHFLEIFSIGLLVDSENGISAMHMTVHVPETANDSAVPLFRMEHGIANSSAGLVCAKMAGVKKAIVDRAYEIIKAIKKRQKVHPLAELLRNDIHMTLDSKHAIRSFVSTSWRDASDDQIDAFFSITERM